jgi:hypothetical protein
MDPNFQLVVPALVPWQTLPPSTSGGLSISAAADDGYPAIDNIWLGQKVEVRFAVDGMDHDLAVLKPYSTESYDCVTVPRILLTEAVKRNRAKFVQVRSAQRPSILRPSGKILGFHIPLTHGGDRRMYKRGEFDVLAAYVAPYKAWYIIPFKECEGRKTIRLYTHLPNSRAYFERFRERWDLLK